MANPVHVRLSDLRGFQRLAIDATVDLIDLVEAMHDTITVGGRSLCEQGREHAEQGIGATSDQGSDPAH